MGRRRNNAPGSGKSEPRGSPNLRTRAEKRLAEKGLAGMYQADLEGLVHELQVHQIELEMQNEELKRSQSEIEESREKYVDLYDFAPVAYFSFDRNGVITDLNLTGASLFGIERSRLVGKPFSLFVSPQHRDIFFAHHHKTRKASQVERCELLIQRKGGSLVPVLMESMTTSDKTGNTIVRSAITNITERTQMEEALRESETKLRAILDGSRDAIGVSKDGICTFTNPACVSLFGYKSADELIGRPVLYLIAPESRGFVKEMVTKRAREEPVPPFYEVTTLKKDGTTFLMEITISSYVLKGEQFTLAIMRDVTEKKKLEEQLRQAQKMEAVGTLAGGVAHDFNDILTVIMGFGNLMQMSIDKDDIHRPYIDQMVASSQRAADLTQSLLAFSRKQLITLEPHAVNEVVAGTTKLLVRLLREDIGLTTNLTDEDTVCPLDVTQIGQVLMNLATNARDAMPHGGSLTITTERVMLDESFKKTHGFGRMGEYVRLSVSDTGTGMDEGTMERIFEPFFTTKEVGKGTGLGLASAYGIVKQHGGYITVESLPFNGTTFDIYLPLINPPSQQEAPAAGETKRGTETILIVEDDWDVRNMLSRILESHGYTTIEAGDGDDAIRVHHEHKEKIDLIILNVVMPGRNGKEALDEITRTNPEIKAIFVSGYTGDIVIDKGIQSEGVDFLQKPLSVTALLAKVREVLDR